MGTLLNSPIGGGRKEDPKRSKVRPKPTKSSPPPEESLENIGAAKNPILITPKISEKPVKFVEPQKFEPQKPPDDIFNTPTTLPVKKATRLDIRSRSPSPTVSTPG